VAQDERHAIAHNRLAGLFTSIRSFEAAEPDTCAVADSPSKFNHQFVILKDTAIGVNKSTWRTSVAKITKITPLSRWKTRKIHERQRSPEKRVPETPHPIVEIRQSAYGQDVSQFREILQDSPTKFARILMRRKFFHHCDDDAAEHDRPAGLGIEFVNVDTSFLQELPPQIGFEIESAVDEDVVRFGCPTQKIELARASSIRCSSQRDRFRRQRVMRREQKNKGALIEETPVTSGEKTCVVRFETSAAQRATVAQAFANLRLDLEASGEQKINRSTEPSIPPGIACLGA
jgi:hypothetical protein